MGNTVNNSISISQDISKILTVLISSMLRYLYVALIFVVLFLSSAFANQNEGLVAYYPFDKKTSEIVKDTSGNGNNCKIHGSVNWVSGDFGSAIGLDGESGYLECRGNNILKGVSTGTIMVWFCPKSLRGGVISWCAGGSWEDLRLVLAFDTYDNNRCRFIGGMSDGRTSNVFYASTFTKTNEWVHYAFTFDEKNICVYKNGILEKASSLVTVPQIDNVPLWIGRCIGLGKEYFDGMIDEVRIYSRTLSAQEIRSIYKQDAKSKGHDIGLFNKLGVKINTYPAPGNIVVTVDPSLMQPLPFNTRLKIDIFPMHSKKPVLQKIIGNVFETNVDVTFNAKAITQGNYDARVSVIGMNDELVGESATANFFWKGQSEAFKGVKVLNNFVWELLNIQGNPTLNIPTQHVINNPYDRWVYINSISHVEKDGEIWVSIDSNSREDAILVHSETSKSSLETMCKLSSGKHTIYIGCNGNVDLKQIVVRSIPVLQYAFYNAQPHIQPYGPYDWEFLSKDILPNVNMVISCGKAEPSQLQEWKAGGGKWISIANVPETNKVDKMYEFWTNSIGFQHPLMDGIIVDEFGGGNDAVYDSYAEAVKKIYSNPQFAGKVFMPYGGTFYRKDRSTQFANVCIDGGGYICWERYLPEQPTQNEAISFIRQRLLNEFPLWEEVIPGVTRKIIMVLGCMSQPTESLNVDPTVNFKVFMDMQFRLLATHPAFFGLGGLQEYHSSYCDEENIRWIGKLYRHYCIEGNTEPLSKDSYKLTHIQNPDFGEGTNGWDVLPAKEGSLKSLSFSCYSWLQGRYPRTVKGDTFLWMKHCAEGPNVFSQEIKDLTPGRLYSLKMITGDYQDLLQGKSIKSGHALSIQIDNAEILSETKKAFQCAFPSNYAHILDKFSQKSPFWMNYHWRVFRAKGTTAKLTVKDWKNDKEPGSPIGQELMYNFIEIQPYLEE
ncbi:MAG: hypothetical protein HW406_63 [Candidatus Brocadiaceae bacterium]|nr:hypothetical protein [Candidatus Brocadiaceae bacterium]